MKILITGAAGFIGYFISKKLLSLNKTIIGIDNLNEYYDVKIKKDRIKNLKNYNNFQFIKIDLGDFKKLDNLFKKYKIRYVIHLAAQAGVRYSIKNPNIYFKNNIEGFFNILELSRKYKIKHLIFASTSSVYGNSKEFPLKESENTDKPLSFYAATKKSNEIMAHSYSNIYKIPSTAVRFFTVYGPFGRPDMALFKFTNKILNNKEINLFNNGKHIRDFTYIDDIISGLLRLINRPSKKTIPYQVYNIGNGNPQKLIKYLRAIEKNLNKKAKIKNLPLQKGDVIKTHADIKLINKKVNYNSNTEIDEGIKIFIKWYRNYYNLD